MRRGLWSGTGAADGPQRPVIGANDAGERPGPLSWAVAEGFLTLFWLRSCAGTTVTKPVSAVFARYSRLVARTVSRLLGPGDQDVEDVAQETFVGLLASGRTSVGRCQGVAHAYRGIQGSSKDSRPKSVSLSLCAHEDLQNRLPRCGRRRS